MFNVQFVFYYHIHINLAREKIAAFICISTLEEYEAFLRP